MTVGLHAFFYHSLETARANGRGIEVVSGNRPRRVSEKEELVKYNPIYKIK
jgi:hypothetical protein